MAKQRKKRTVTKPYIKGAWVRLDVMDFLSSVLLHQGDLEEWVLSLVKCLSSRDPSLNELGAKLLSTGNCSKVTRNVNN